MKYNLGVPLYRFLKYMLTFNLILSPQDLSNYVMLTMERIEPLYNEIERHLVKTEFKVIHGDETTIQV